MAKHKSLGSLGRSIVKIAKDLQPNTIDGVRKAALVVDQVAVIKTPVDTGYARSRWVASIGIPVAAEVGVQRKVEIGGEIAAAIAISQADKMIKSWKGIGSIFISNPLGYVVYLDQGSSEQAPEGISDDAIQAGLSALRDIRILGR